MADSIDPSAKANGHVSPFSSLFRSQTWSLTGQQYYKDRLYDSDSSPSLGSRPQIRLLFLYPAEYGVVVQGHLETFELESAPPYKALSYSWGDKTSSSIIILGDGFHFRVRRNLEDALQRIRSPSDVVYVWIDGVCINQADNEERSRQVGLMGEVFSSAEEVIVWLGETRTLPGVEEAVYGGAIGLAQQKELIWWRRLWVVQETVTARTKPKILFGPSQMEWEPFLLRWRELCRRPRQTSSEHAEAHADQLDFIKGGLKALEMLSQLWETSPEHRKLHRMLVQTRYHVCADDHDRIYGLLYLMAPEERELFMPDYNSPTGNVFAIATAQILRTSSLGFDILLRYWNRGMREYQSTWWLDFAHPLPENDIPFFCTGRSPAVKTLPDIDLEIATDYSLLDAVRGRDKADSRSTRLLRARGVTFEPVDLVRPFATFFEGKGKAFSIANLIDFFKDIRYREKHNKMTFFAPKVSRLSLSKYRKPISELPLEMFDLRLGFVQSLIWIYRTYAAVLSERMEQALEALSSVSDEEFRPEEVNTPVDEIHERIDQTIEEDLNLLMSRLYPVLSKYALFVTPSGFVGFCRHFDIRNDARREYHAPVQGDIVVQFNGASFPFVMRQSADKRSFRESLADLTSVDSRPKNTRFTIVDGCCLPAIMDGQLLRRARDGVLSEQVYTVE